MAVRGTDAGEALALLGGRAGVTQWRASGPGRREPEPARPPTAEASAQLTEYVEACAERLWKPSGRPIRRWLMGERGLPEEVLRANHIGADPGPRIQPRPTGVPRVGGAVLPVLEEGRAIFAQVRRVSSGPRGWRYLNVSADLAPNPRIGWYDPGPGSRRPTVLVTEGVIDALSAAAAGYGAAAVLGASLVDDATVTRLRTTTGPFMVVFDDDFAGRIGAQQLVGRLRERSVSARPMKVPPGVRDLNDWMCRSRDWPRELTANVKSQAMAQRTRSLS
jgi:hypothetical protein